MDESFSVIARDHARDLDLICSRPGLSLVLSFTPQEPDHGFLKSSSRLSVERYEANHAQVKDGSAIDLSHVKT